MQIFVRFILKFYGIVYLFSSFVFNRIIMARSYNLYLVCIERCFECLSFSYVEFLDCLFCLSWKVFTDFNLIFLEGCYIFWLCYHGMMVQIVVCPHEFHTFLIYSSGETKQVRNEWRPTHTLSTHTHTHTHTHTFVRYVTCTLIRVSHILFALLFPFTQ